MSAVHLLVGGLALAAAALVCRGHTGGGLDAPLPGNLGLPGCHCDGCDNASLVVEAQRCPLSTLTPWMFLVPIVGLVLGIVLLDERPDAFTAAGVALVLVSMWVTSRQHGGAGPGHLNLDDQTVGALR